MIPQRHTLPLVFHKRNKTKLTEKKKQDNDCCFGKYISVFEVFVLMILIVMLIHNMYQKHETTFKYNVRVTHKYIRQEPIDSDAYDYPYDDRTAFSEPIDSDAYDYPYDDRTAFSEPSYDDGYWDEEWSNQAIQKFLKNVDNKKFEYEDNFRFSDLLHRLCSNSVPVEWPEEWKDDPQLLSKNMKENLEFCTMIFHELNDEEH